MVRYGRWSAWSFSLNPQHGPLPEVVRRQDGIVRGQVRVEVARVQVLVRLAAVEQFLRGSVFRVESKTREVDVNRLLG